MKKKDTFRISPDELYHQLFSNSVAAFSLTSKSGQVLECNEAMEKITGYSKSELLNLNINGLYSDPHDRQRMMDILNRDGKVEDFEAAIIRKSEEIGWVSLSSKFIELEGKTVLLTTGIDITNRKATEKELAIFKDFAAASGMGYGFADLEGNIIYANLKLSSMLGLSSPEDTLGTNVASYYPEDISRDLVNNILPAVMKTGQWVGELPLRSIKGELTPAIQNITLIRDNNGEPLYFGNVITDISERKKAEEQLKLTFHIYNDLIQLSPSGMFIYQYTPPDKLILERGNPAAEKLTGIKIRDWVGKEFNEIWPEAKRRGIFDAFLGAVKTGNPYSVDDVYYVDQRLEGAFRVNAFGIPGGKLVVAFENVFRQKKAEEELQFKENIIESTSSVIATCDLDGIMTYVNPAFLKIWGYDDVDEIYGRPFWEFWMVKDNLDEILPPLFKEGIWTDEYKAKKKDGTIFDVHVLATMVHDKNGNPISLMSSSIDITESKKVEERFRMAAQVSSDLIYEWNIRDGTILWFGNLDEALGYAPGEISRTIEGWVKLIHPDDAAKMADAVEYHKKSTEPIDYEYRIKHKDGSWRHWKDQAAPVLDEKSRPYKWIGTCTDITYGVRAKRALQESEERYKSLFQTAPIVILYLSPAGDILDFNPEAERLYGWNREQTLGKNYIELYVSEDQQDDVRNDIAKVLKGTPTRNFENTIRTVDNTERLMTWNVDPVRDSRGNMTGIVAAGQDITDTKRLQDLAIRAQRLETAGRIAGQVAHDFNNLLGPIRAYPELIKSQLQSDDSIWRLADDMEKAAMKMAEINNQLLTLSRRGHYKLEPLNLNDIVEDAVNQVSSKPDRTEINLDLCPVLMNIMGGRSQIYRVIDNLINNAKDAMMDHGRLNIKTENYYADNNFGKLFRIPKGEYVRLVVSDTGHGIQTRNLSKIFEPFFTTKTSDRQRGSGLGLSIVHAVMEDHNGFIDCQTEVDSGTSFYLYFPATREQMDTRPSDHIIGGTESILIVDDDELQRKVACTILENLGYKVISADSGENALKLLEKSPRDLLIIDMVMPEGIDGTETYRRALEINPEQRALLISGYAESERVKEALNLGAGDFIRKPLTIKTIALAVRKEFDRMATRGASF